MSFMNRHRDDSGFEEAWRAFAEDDAGMQAPSSLEARVFNAIEAQSSLAPRPRRSHLARVASLAAILVLTTTVLLRYQRGNERPSSMPVASRPAQAQAPALPEVSVPLSISSTPRAVVAEAREALPRARSPRPSAREVLPPVLMALGAGPVRDTEALQLVRLRLPREALQGLGVVLLEPDAAGVVDVDVLIGEDGLARDIRQVRTGGEHP